MPLKFSAHNLILLFILSFALQSCMMPKIAYIQSSPQIYAKKTPSSVNVVLSENIKNDFQISSSGVKKVSFTDFRKTLKDGFTTILNKKFSSVTFSESQNIAANKADFTLLIDLMRPQTIKGATLVNQDGYAVNHEIKFKQDYRVILKKTSDQNENIIEGTVVSNQSTQLAAKVSGVYKDALNLTLEEIAKKL